MALPAVRRVPVSCCIVVAVVGALLSCSSDDRPSASEWGPRWRGHRDLIPEEAAFVDQGEDLCGPLLGDLRAGRTELVPTPTKALDDAVDAWIVAAESIAFDCPTESPDQLAERLHELEVLAAEIDAGLEAEQVS